MSSLQLFEESEVTCPSNKLKKETNRIKHILKSKENISQHRCRKELKKKLKKYKLRHDGQEDPEVLDVSKILLTLLKIKSPNHGEDNNKPENIFDDKLTPRNYLFRMGRRKQILNKTDAVSCDIIVNNVCLKQNLPEEVIDKAKSLKSSSEIVESEDVDLTSTKENNKIQTNAFKLLMDSRNKSIGSNSPGKEKLVDECQLQETIDKKNAKVKRTLLLQKMAEAKGSLKNKEIEEYQEKQIQKKMDKRAERLKSLILNYEPKSTSKERKSYSVEKGNIKEDQLKTKIDKTLQKHKLHLLFQQSTVREEKTAGSEYIPKEDKKFLQKLSPSLKKRENMLCYFKKIEKDENIHTVDTSESDDNVLIKVKLTTKTKKKVKKRKLSLNKQVVNNDLEIIDKPETVGEVHHAVPDVEEVILNNNGKEMVAPDNKVKVEVDVLRPKRNVKRPAKYTDDILISSSDEELHIFTPKKKKQIIRQIDTNNIDDGEEIKPKKSSENKKIPKLMNITKSKNTIVNSNQKKPAKLAPIFNAKPQLDAAALEAKQRFLSSGVPDKLKKAIEKQNNQCVLTNTFTTVVHIQQSKTSFAVNPIGINYIMENSDDDSDKQVESKEKFKDKWLNEQNSQKCEPLPNKFNFHSNMRQLLMEHEVQAVLQGVKESYPQFPVYRTYRLLKDKCKGQYRNSSYLDFDNSIEVMDNMIDIFVDSPDRLTWTDKYKPMSSKEIIGNFETTKELKKWLVTWTENDVKTKKYNKSDSDSSDFYYSDTDSKDNVKLTNNLLILSGPVGSGKTSIVYAVAAELAIKVLEVNASSKRTGKIMLQDLQEATQSHKVNRGKSSSSQECSQKLQEVIEVEVTKPKKRGRPKKIPSKLSKKLENVASQEECGQPQVSQDSTRTCMSLILIDDADIVFEQDDGFCSAIVQLVQCSKRPVILITSSTTCPHLQKFVNTARILKTRPLQPRMLGTWLDILCFVENNKWCPGIGAQVLGSFHGDIRKTINYLQFYFPKDTLIVESAPTENTDFLKISMENESSSMSWADKETTQDKNDIVIPNFSKTNNSLYYLIDKNSLLHFAYPINLFKIWWNVPKILNVPTDNPQTEQSVVKIISKQPKKISHVQAMSNALDAISVADYFGNRDFTKDVTDSPWLNLEQDSVSEEENSNSYSQHCMTANEISHELVMCTIVNSQKILGIDENNYLESPGTDVKREKERTISRHNNLTDYVNLSIALDRRALALDYWSGCRSICRIEKTKTDNNIKRNNRYCHYLKSLNVLNNNDSLDNLSKSLSLRKKK